METKHVTLDWKSGLRFTGGEPGGPVVGIDADNVTAPGPMLQLLLAVASCSASDVVIILEKMRTGLSALRVEAWGERRDDVPRRYTRLRLRFTASGPGVDASRLRRAVDLSVEKYCSVMHTLDPALAVECEVVVE